MRLILIRVVLIKQITKGGHYATYTESFSKGKIGGLKYLTK